MEFREGADVLTAAGEKAGEVERVVIDPRTRKVTHLVVGKGFLFTENRVLPIEVIDGADENGVLLKPTVDEDLDDWPVFEETYTIPIEEAGVRDTLDMQDVAPAARPAPAYYWYPPVGAGYSGNLGLPYYPGTVVEVERNVPEGAAALKEGTAIYSLDDERVGDVERIFTDSTTDAVTHILISRGFLFKNYKLVPASWIDSANDDEVRLSVGRAVLERLPDFDKD